MPIPSWLLVWCQNILTLFTLSLSGHHSLPTTGNCFPYSRYVLYWFMWVWNESNVNYLCWSKHPSRPFVSPLKSPRKVKMKIIIVMLPTPKDTDLISSETLSYHLFKSHWSSSKVQLAFRIIWVLSEYLESLTSGTVSQERISLSKTQQTVSVELIPFLG